MSERKRADAPERQFLTQTREELKRVLDQFTALNEDESKNLIPQEAMARIGQAEAGVFSLLARLGPMIDDAGPLPAAGAVTAFALRPLIAEVIGAASLSAEKSRTRLELHVGEDLPIAIRGDRGRLHQALFNLLEHAVSVVPGGEVKLEVIPEYQRGNATVVSFVVAGERALDAMGALRDAPDTIALTVAQRILTALGTKLEEDKPDVRRAQHRFRLELTHAAPPAPPEAPQYVTLVGMPVLFVSGNARERAELSTWLKGWRMLPQEADSANVALALLERGLVDNAPVPLVLLTRNLPLQDGFVLGFRIKHHPRLADVTTVMLAEQGVAGDAVRCRESGIAAYLRRPYTAEQVNRAITRVMGVTDDGTPSRSLVTRFSLAESRREKLIVVIDPDDTSAALISATLKKYPVIVIGKATLEEGLEQLAADTCQLLIVNVDRLGVAAEDALNLLRATMKPRDAVAPVIAIAKADVPMRDALMFCGYSAVIDAPVEKLSVLSAIKASGVFD